MFDAIIVGGGVSGLTAAYKLSKNGKKVVLVSPDPIGGMLVTKEQDGFTLEQGPNVLLEKPEISQLIDDLGMRDRVIYPVTEAYRQFVWHGSKAYQVPKSPAQFIKSDLFSLSEKLRILRAIFTRGVFQPGAEEETVAEFFGRALGISVTRRTLDPVLKGIYGGSVDSLSAAALFPTLWESMKGGDSILQYLKARKRSGHGKPKTFVLKGGMIALAHRLVEKSGPALKLVSGNVNALEQINGEYQVVLDDGARFAAPQVVLALSARDAAKIMANSSIGESAHEFIENAQRRRYAPLTLVHCATEEIPTFPPHSFGILFPEGTPHFFLGAMFNSLLFPHLAPRGKQLLTLCFGGIGALKDAQALSPSATVIAELCQKYLGISSVSQLATYSWSGAIPQYEIGHQSFLKSIVELEERLPNLTLAVVDRGGVGVPDRVRSVLELLDR